MADIKQQWQWYLTPAVLILIGMIMLTTLCGVDRIFKRQGINSTLVDALMQIQIDAFEYHLQIEEAAEGAPTADVAGAVAGMERAIGLVGIILDGGSYPGYGTILEPLKDPLLRARAIKVQTLLLDLKQSGSKLLQYSTVSAMGSVADQQYDRTFIELMGNAKALEHTFAANRAGNRGKARKLLLGAVMTWTAVMAVAVAGLWRLEMRRKFAAESLIKAHDQLLVQAEELTEHRENLTRLVNERTTELTGANAQLLVKIAEQRKTEEILREAEQQNRNLSNRLLQAQEMERKHISMELHDAFGHALNVVKLKVRFIEKGLLPEQPVLKEDCEQLLDYMDHVIEDVRRLSLDLSPTILEDLGLTSAIQWLVSNVARIQNVRITHEIAKIDHLFPESQWITIYRVIQEALTNIGRHAEAGNAAVTIRLGNDAVLFSIEDDGIGFDPGEASMKGAPEKGLGLSTMNERVKMMGGVFNLRSRSGEGTRVSFRIPFHGGEA